MANVRNYLLGELLRKVSRSFYTTLRILPRDIRPQIGLAYLLARTTDTIADTALVPLDERLNALEALRARILGDSGETLNFLQLAQHQGSPAERWVLEQSESSVVLLETFSPADRQLIRSVLEIIISGQALDLRRFSDASAARIVPLNNPAELDDYTYRVAGCVGEFWTRICRAHLFPNEPLDENALLAEGVRFGKGLQLVNILRDVPADLRQGRCYLPAHDLAACGLQPVDLLDFVNERRVRPLYNAWLDRAQAHLEAGWAYTLALPRWCWRLRLACAWPLLIGRDTLALLRTHNPLDPARRIKISRARVRSIILRTVINYPWSGRWEKLFAQKRPVEPAACPH